MRAVGFVGGVILVLIGTVLFGLVWLCFIGLSVGAANAWIIEGTFSDGWHSVWDRWFISLLWSLLFGGGTLAGVLRNA